MRLALVWAVFWALSDRAGTLDRAFAFEIVKIHDLASSDGSVVFRIEVRDVRSVYVAGSFNNWGDNQGGVVTDERHAMSRVDEHLYEIKLAIAPGEHRFKFVLDDHEWISPPGFKKDQDDNALFYVTDDRQVSKVPPAPPLPPAREWYDLPPAGGLSDSPAAYVGWIPVMPVNAGEVEIIDLHRFFSPGKNNRLKIAPHPNVGAAFVPESFELHVRPNANFSGILDLPLWVLDESGDTRLSAVLTLAVARRGVQVFSHKPSAQPQKIIVAGSFNDWNQDKTPMTDPDGDGTYEARAWLEPGAYTYKFVVDGNWIPDPSNPDSTPDGFGGFNSIITLEGAGTGRNPHAYADRQTRSDIEVALVPGDEPIRDVSVVLQTREGSSRPVAFERLSDRVRISRKGAPAGSWVRVVAADRKGRVSPAVRCPLAEAEKFRWQDGVIYFVFLDRFANGDPSNDRPVSHADLLPQANYHGGDLAGLAKKIDDGYFDRLGVNVLWLSPLNRNPDTAFLEYLPPYRWYSGYHGYWPVSSTEVDPHFGDMRGLAGLVGRAHRRGIRIIVDLVLKHVHESHPYRLAHPDWFGSLLLPDGRKNLRLWDEYAFTTWFEPFLPAFDFSNAEAERALIENSIWWARTAQLDGFRLDAVKHIPPSFWRKFRSAFRDTLERERSEPLYLVGETFRDRRGIMSFVGPNMLDGQFDFPLYDTVKSVFALEQSGFQDLEASLSASERIYGKETIMSTLIGNHDKSRFMAYADGDLPDPKEPDEEEVGWRRPPAVDRPERYARIKLAMTFLLALDGVPMIYYGDEFGISGAGDPDNRRDMRFGEQLTAAEKDVLAHFSGVSALRRRHPALRYGSRRALLVEPDRYVFLKTYFEDRVLVALNRSPDTATVSLAVAPEFKDGTYTNELDGRKLTVKNGSLTLPLGGHSAAIVAAKRR
ncbi:MAG: hypothetical protein A3G34_16505 [Candidatus Lindowbacteria bacterium RIFCSPLOWO2_12_FULL_62_27]|nr:MAG: hypothetical protein A3I06_00105 [Candidatus Lindowbacteria bacterium RIFCSPLOWO2_02_FULL_62_12]OGH58341.1 MAG: hypothetical protein A3G34_16505 [Candidatus Lindowbacteria bacterium RIFCSPLOWO2_12_FULL_62_27]